MDQEARNPVQTSRRDFLNGIGAGFSSLAMTGMLSADGFFHGKDDDQNKHKAKKPHHPPKAKNCIFLFMYGGPSQMETFDYKPKM